MAQETTHPLKSCTHKVEGPFTITVKVLGEEFTLPIEKPLYCAECIKAYIERFATLCADCGKIIYPGQPVCGPSDKARYPSYEFSHLTAFGNCNDYPGALCGTWGESKDGTRGELIPFEEFARI